MKKKQKKRKQLNKTFVLQFEDKSACAGMQKYVRKQARLDVGRKLKSGERSIKQHSKRAMRSNGSHYAPALYQESTYIQAFQHGEVKIPNLLIDLHSMKLNELNEFIP